MNWWRNRSHISKNPLPLSPYLLHLYQQNGCVNEVEVDALMIAEDEATYKLSLDIEQMEAGIEELLSALTVPELPLAVPTPESRRPAATLTRDEPGPSWEPHWRDIDKSSFEYPETPFKRIREEIIHLQNHYFRLEHNH